MGHVFLANVLITCTMALPARMHTAEYPLHEAPNAPTSQDGSVSSFNVMMPEAPQTAAVPEKALQQEKVVVTPALARVVAEVVREVITEVHTVANAPQTAQQPSQVPSLVKTQSIALLKPQGALPAAGVAKLQYAYPIAATVPVTTTTPMSVITAPATPAMTPAALPLDPSSAYVGTVPAPWMHPTPTWSTPVSTIEPVQPLTPVVTTAPAQTTVPVTSPMVPTPVTETTTTAIVTTEPASAPTFEPAPAAGPATTTMVPTTPATTTITVPTAVAEYPTDTNPTTAAAVPMSPLAEGTVPALESFDPMAPAAPATTDTVPDTAADNEVAAPTIAGLGERAAVRYAELLSKLDPAAHGSPAVPTAARPLASKALVLIEDHGTGSSSFGSALDAHPCMVDMGESFVVADPNEAGDAPIWISLRPEKRAGIWGKTGSLLNRATASLRYKLSIAKVRNSISQDTPLEVPGLYDGLPLDLGEYFTRITDHICAHVNTTKCPPGNACAATFKFFPQYIFGHTSPDTIEVDVGTTKEEVVDGQEAALTLWERSIQQLINNPRVGVLHLHRKEVDRELSIYRRFHGTTTISKADHDFYASKKAYFDCDMPRPPSLFEQSAFAMVPQDIQIESCWKSTLGAMGCLALALEVVGLSNLEMTAAGPALLTPDSDHHNDEGAASASAGASCSGGGMLHFNHDGTLAKIQRNNVPDFTPKWAKWENAGTNGTGTQKDNSKSKDQKKTWEQKKDAVDTL